MSEALADSRVDGIWTNISLVRALFEDDALARGEVDIYYT